MNFGLNETWKLVFEHLEKIVEQDLKVFESSKKFRSRLQEDLFNLGRALGKIDNCLRKLDIAFDQFKQIKIKTIQLYLIQSHEDLVNNRKSYWFMEFWVTDDFLRLYKNQFHKRCWLNKGSYGLFALRIHY